MLVVGAVPTLGLLPPGESLLLFDECDSLEGDGDRGAAVEGEVVTAAIEVGAVPLWLPDSVEGMLIVVAGAEFWSMIELGCDSMAAADVEGG